MGRSERGNYVDKAVERRTTPKVALTIAGFDPSSGAGITADLQTFAAHGIFGISTITALTVQSTQGVVQVVPVAGNVIRDSLSTLQADLPPDGIKIGMLGSDDAVLAVVEYLHGLPRRPPVVLDPVLRSSSGTDLLSPEALMSLRDRLLPLVDVVTPNWAELAVLAGSGVDSPALARAAVSKVRNRYPHLTVVATGGDQVVTNDLLETDAGEQFSIPGARIETTSTHGTGCAFSSACLAGLFGGQTVLAAATGAKRFVEGALRRAPGLGKGHGPMDLLWPLRQVG